MGINKKFTQEYSEKYVPTKKSFARQSYPLMNTQSRLRPFKTTGQDDISIIFEKTANPLSPYLTKLYQLSMNPRKQEVSQ